MNRRFRVLLGVGGGIAAYKSAILVRRLVEQGCDVRCALTRSAESFVAPLTLEVLSGNAVYGQEYLSATGRGEESHIVAAEWADLLLITPATAHVLGRLALGLADDFLTTTVLAFTGPMVVSPAMHADMWAKEAIEQHVKALRRRGIYFVGPLEGPLASGEWGMGRMAEPEDIAGEVTQILREVVRPSGTPRPLAGRRVLISAGPTHEPIDPVRFLGNRSSGKMGFALAAQPTRMGAETILGAGPVALPTPTGVQRVDVSTALEMRTAIHEHLASIDLVVMTAAVGDFRPRVSAPEKLKKIEGIPDLQLEANPDILAELRVAAPEALLVGFAAETQPTDQEARAKLERKQAHYLVVNDVSRRDIGFGVDENEVTVYGREGKPIFLSRRPKRELAAALLRMFAEKLPNNRKESLEAIHTAG
jgi:phosphopantothenoylcysteine decarboxylase/phosphopantothenate--cysteine ligase